MYPGGLRAAHAHFDDAWEWALRYPFSNLSGFVSGEQSPIIHSADSVLGDVSQHPALFKAEAKDLLSMHLISHGADFKELMLESW